MFIFLLFVSSCYSNLISDREFTAKIRIHRFNSEWELYTSYSDLYTVPEMRYVVGNIGNYSSRYLALTYDEIAVMVNKITGKNIITIKSLYLPVNNRWITADILLTQCLINVVIKNKEHKYYETKYLFFIPESQQIYYEHSIPDKNVFGTYSSDEISSLCRNIFLACNHPLVNAPNYLKNNIFNNIDTCINFMKTRPTRDLPCLINYSYLAFIQPNIYCTYMAPNSQICVNNYSECELVPPMKSPYICQCIGNQTNCVVYDNTKLEAIYNC